MLEDAARAMRGPSAAIPVRVPRSRRRQAPLGTVFDEVWAQNVTPQGRSTGHPHVERDDAWIRCLGAMARSQGWKLHISAGVGSAEAVLRRALPILLAERASFKVVASLERLAELSANASALSQVGKFITVYPTDDAQGVRLAALLDEATWGLPGPMVLSDRPLRPGSLVHYRYGSFRERYVQTAIGTIELAIRQPDGELVPDPRGSRYDPPSWVVDPFVATGVSPEWTPDDGLNEPYVVIDTLHESPRGAIHRAIDLRTGRLWALKRARRYALLDEDGRDARDRLRHEADVLVSLAPDSRFPSVRGVVEQGADLVLVMEYLSGATLEGHVLDIVRRGRLMPSWQVIRWGLELTAALRTIHERGWYYRDLKAQNVIVGPDARLRLVDFELAYRPASGQRPFGRGTPGYTSPQQAACRPSSVTDDVYSLGALLYFAATGAQPPSAPRPSNLLERPLASLNPLVPPSLANVIQRCLDPSPLVRFASMSAAEQALERCDDGKPPAASLSGTDAGIDRAARGGPAWARAWARRLGDALCRAAVHDPARDGLIWADEGLVRGIFARDLDTGSAGVVLALAGLVVDGGTSEQRACLIEGARWLASPRRQRGSALSGLYVGEAGVGAALLRAGQVLGDDRLVVRAVERGRWVAAQPHASPDLFGGTAGRLRFHLLLWDETGEAEHLRAAVSAGESLLASAQGDHVSGYRWIVPPGFGPLSGNAFLGYARGAAGIADSLLDLFEATTDERFLGVAESVARWLTDLATPAPGDGDQPVSWPTVEGGPYFGNFWCHGAAGIGGFLLHAGQFGWAARAARTTADGSRWGGPGQCHGLAGNIEFLLDMFQSTGDATYLADAELLGQLLRVFLRQPRATRAGHVNAARPLTTSYMFGLAGIMVCLLRLADPRHVPRQLSRRGYRRRATRSGRPGTLA